MPLFPVILASISLLVWIVLAFFRGGFWQLRAFEDSSRENPPPLWPRVVAVVPARNEVGTIAHCVESLIGQNYPGGFQIIVVDDHSEDGTGELARAVAQSDGKPGQVTIIQAEELQQGWTGKLWALQQGVRAAAHLPSS